MIQISAGIPEFVRMRGVVYPGHEKAPFVKSGKSVHGCVAVNVLKDLLQCHECGEWFESLASHVAHGAHGLSVKEYKLRHGLRQATSLVNRRIQAAHSAAARPDEGRRSLAVIHREGRLESRRGRGHREPRYETRNENGTCHAQLLERVAQVVKECGGTPASGEFARRGVHLASLLDSFNVPGIPELMDRLGYGRHKWGGAAGRPKLEEAFLLDAIRDFYVKRNRLPKESEWGHGGLPCQGTYTKRFGSVGIAYGRAGLALVAQGRQGLAVSNETIFQSLCQFYRAHGRSPRWKEFMSPALPFSALLLRNRFGSVISAMRAAGIDVAVTGGCWNTALTRHGIMTAMERFYEKHGVPPTSQTLKAVLGVSLPTIWKYFGTVQPELLMQRVFAERAQSVA